MDVAVGKVTPAERLPDRIGSLLGPLTVSLVLSGASGLIYQVVWFRFLGLTFGVTAYASSAVLAAFMAGLALGSFISGAIADKLKRPLFAYGIVEVIIGLSGLASLPAFELLQPLYRWLAVSVTDSLPVISTVRFGLAFAIMLLPTTAMGATLPFIVKSSVARSEAVARNVSLLYAANTFGAIAGAYMAGFFLIGTFGITVTTAIAAGFNLVVGIGWILANSVKGAPATTAAPKAVTEPSKPPVPSILLSETARKKVQAAVLVSYGISGGVALAYEVIWTRVLSGIVLGTVYAFSIMLCATLAGIAVGSWAVERYIERKANWLVVYVVLEALMGVGAILSIAVMGQGYRLETFIRTSLNLGAEPILGDFSFIALLALLAIFPTALLMGVTFPVAAKLWTDGHADVGKRIGTIYGANVLGAIIGSLAAGLLLIPLLGAQKALIALGALNLVAGVLVLAYVPVPRRLVYGLGAAAVFAVLAFITPDIYQQLFSSDPRGEETIWYQEGHDATIRVTKDADGNQVLYVNGDGQNTDAPAELPNHYQLGLIGTMLHPHPKEMLVVGLAAGLTSGAASMNPSVDVTVAELHPGVIEAAKLFEHANFNLLNRPNVHVVANDGRNYLLLSGRKFDVIESDPIWPTNAGAANVYSADYYRLARQSLNDDGLMVQWVDRSLPESAYKMMLRSFIEVYPDATLWYHGTILVGSKKPLDIDTAAIDAKFSDPDLRALLDWVGIRSANDLLREFVSRPDELAAYVGSGPIVSDRTPFIEYVVSRPAVVGADLRWRRMASYLTARERPEDGIVYGLDSIRGLLGEFHEAKLAEYVPPQDIKGKERDTEAALKTFMTGKDRVWFLPFWTNDTDIWTERWLNINAYKVLNQAVGNIRATLYATPGPEPAIRPVDFLFGKDVRLTGWGLDKSDAAVGDIIRLVLNWRAEQAIDENIKVHLLLTDQTGKAFYVHDRLPLDNPTTSWRKDERLVDRYGILIPPGTPAGVYNLEVGLYYDENAERLVPANPNAPGQKVVLGQIQVRDAERTLSPESVDAAVINSVNFEDSAKLAGYTIEEGTRRPGDLIPVTLYWQVTAEGANRAGKIFVGDPAKPSSTAAVTVALAGKKGGAIIRSDTDVHVPPSLAAGRYDLWLQLDGSAAKPVRLGGVDVTAPQRLPAPAAPERQISAKLGDFATLAGSTVKVNGSTVRVDLVWQAEKEVDTQYTVFVHLVDASGRIIAQSDQQPAGGGAPTTSWTAGLRVGDSHTLNAASIPAGARLIAGMYDPATFKRVAGPNGAETVELPWP